MSVTMLKPSRRRLSRREFLKLGGAATASALLAGCAGQIVSPVEISTQAPTQAPSQTLTSLPTALPKTPTLAPTEAPLEPTRTPYLTSTQRPAPTEALTLRRPDLIKFYPAALSKVVRARHSGVWNNGELVPPALDQMLDVSITQLTGLDDPGQAWKALFDPGERVAIKVNTIAGSSAWTKPVLVDRVVERLLAAGLSPENIFIYDRDIFELEGAGFTIVKDGNKPRCLGTGYDYTFGWSVMGRGVGLSNILLSCDALINMPVLKQHMLSGFSFAFKNHYGTFNKPSSFHTPEDIRLGLPELNALPPIKDRTRLIIGDALTVVLGDSWDSRVEGDSIFMSFDPLAHDYNGLQVFQEVFAATGRDPARYKAMAESWMETGAKLGLGTNDPAHMEIKEVKIA